MPAVTTVTLATPLRPSTFAATIALPGARAVTTPSAETARIVGLPEDHTTGLPSSVLPLASLTVAVSVVVAPTAMVTEGGATVTLATASCPVGPLSAPHPPKANSSIAVHAWDRRAKLLDPVM